MKELVKKVIRPFLHLNTNYSLDDLLANPKLLERKTEHYIILKKLFPFISFHFYWENIIEEIEINYNCKKESIEQLFVFELEKNRTAALIIPGLAYYTKTLDNVICEAIIQYLLCTNNRIIRYWFTQDISRYTFHLQNGFYANYYVDRNRLLKKIALESNLVIPSKRTESTNSLCIIVPMLNKDIKHSVERVTAMIANGLSDKFEEVHIITLDTFSPSCGDDRLITTLLPYQSSLSMKDEIYKHFFKNVKVHFPEGKDYIEKAQFCLNRIYEINPKIIFDISDEYSFISYYYSNDFNTMYLPLRDNVSSSFFSYLVGPKDIASDKIKQYKLNEDIKIINWILPETIPNTDGTISRFQLGVEQGDFVMLTVGNNTTVIKEDFAQEIVSFIETYSNVKWILVGGNAPKFMHREYEQLFSKKRIIEWGYEEHLYSLCSQCDILLRPNTTGGAGTMAIAAYAKLPIVMTKNVCDATRWLGVDYSSNNNYSDMIKQLINLHEDSVYLDGERQRIYDIVTPIINAKKCWDALYSFMR